MAVYGFLYDKNPIPPELQIGLDWLNFHTPYIFGGLRDQPIRLFRRMKRAVRVHEAVIAWKFKFTPTAASEKYWYAVHADDMKILHFIWNQQYA